jgi:STAS-like domain of unknown function (DUF4325)
MPQRKEVAELSVLESVGKLLMLRDSVIALFEKVESLDAPRVVLDFANVDFVSRSFADEYLLAKSRSRKTLEERNLPPQARLMIESVSHRIESIRANRSPSKTRFSARVARMPSP